MEDDEETDIQPLDKLVIPNKFNTHNIHQRLRDTFYCLLLFIFVWSFAILALGRYTLINFNEKTLVERELGITPV